MKKVRFTLEAPGAQQAYLAGDFTDWERNARLMRRGTSDNMFVATVELPEGTHEYKYIVDGDWFEDPASESVPNRFGTRNSVVTVGAAPPPRKRRVA